MLPNAFLVIVLTLVGYVTAKELSIKTDGDRVILGYRTVHPVCSSPRILIYILYFSRLTWPLLDIGRSKGICRERSPQRANSPIPTSVS